MTVRTITSHVLNLHGAARAGDLVSFRLLTGTYSATEHVPEDTATATIDGGGDISIDLYCPASYACIVAGAMVFSFVLPDDPTTPTTLEALHATTAAPATATNEVQTLLDTAALRGNNLSDMTNPVTARTNLGVYSTAQADTLLAAKATTAALTTETTNRTNADTTLTAAQTAAAAAVNHAGTLTLAQALAAAAGTVYNVQAYGAVGDGATDDAAAIRVAIAAAKAGSASGVYGGRILAPRTAGGYKIGSTLDFSSLRGMFFDGQGSTFTWAGGATGAMFQLRDARDCTFQDFFIACSSAAPLQYGIQCYNDSGASTWIPTANRFINIDISSSNNGGLTTGVYLGADSGSVDANNENHTFINCSVTRYSDTAFDQRGSQIYNAHYIACRFNGVNYGQYGVKTYRAAYTNGGAFIWDGGSGGYNTGADFYIGSTNSQPITVRGFVSENSNRFFETVVGNVHGSYTLENNRMGATGLNADGNIIKVITGGKLAVHNNIIGTDVVPSSALSLYFSPLTAYRSGVFLCDGNLIATSLTNPFSNTPPTVQHGTNLLVTNAASPAAGTSPVPVGVAWTSLPTTTTPAVDYVNRFKTNNTNPTGITTFTNGYIGKQIHVWVNDTHTWLVSGSNLKLPGSVDIGSSGTPITTGSQFVFMQTSATQWTWVSGSSL